MALESVNLVVAGPGPGGEPTFIDVETSLHVGVRDSVESLHLWATQGTPTLPAEVGAVPAVAAFPLPGAASFRIVRLAERSAGKTVLAESHAHVQGVEHGVGGDPEMHRTNTIDFEYIIEGKVDVELSSGEIRTVQAGDFMIMGGVSHAWKNRYDEPCTFVVVVTGANSA